MSAEIDAELDRFREELFTAFNKGEYKRMLETYVHKDVIATWQDGTTSKGYDEVLAQFDKLHQFISRMQVQPTTDKRVILQDGTLAVSSGNMRDTYDLRRGGQGIYHPPATVGLESRWSATLIKQEGRWVLVSFSASTNAFNNQVVSLYLWTRIWVTAAIAGVVGLAGGFVLRMLLS
jgi:hypothetical protein